MHYTNPVYPKSFADPFVWRHDDWYYAVGTGPCDEIPGKKTDGVFPLLRSRDLLRWEPIGTALQGADAAWGDTHWAPEVAFHDGVFYLYYSVGFADKHHQIRVATSRTPEGPFHDSGTALIAPPACPFAIDPHPFRDADGQWYLFYATDFLDNSEDARVGTALRVQRLEGMTRLVGEPTVVLRARYDWQRFQAERPMYGGVYDWHTLEGPAVLRHDGRYYCFYSGGRWENETYGVDYAVAEHVLGPYTTDCPAGPRVLRTIAGRVLGPGHNSFTKSPDGKSDIIVYHAWDPGMTARRLCVDPLRWTPDGPRCDGPSWSPRELD